MIKDDSVKRVIVRKDSILRNLLPVSIRYSIAFWKCELILLGAGVAHGFLHGLPTPCCNTIGMYVLNSLYLQHIEFEILIFRRFLPIFNSSNIVATKSLSSPFGYNDCDTSQYIHYSQSTHQQPSSSSNVLGVNMAIERDSSVSEAQLNSDGIFNRLNQYPLPMPPLPPNIQLPYQTVAPTTIGETERYQLH